MKYTIFIRILTSFLIINLLLVFSISLIAYQKIKSHYLDTLRTYITGIADSSLMPISSLLKEGQFAALDNYAKELGKKSDFRVTVIDPLGIVLADSDKSIEDMDNHRDRSEIITALQGVKGESIRFSSSLKTDMLYIAIPIRDDNQVIGVLRISLFLNQIDALIYSLRRELFLIGLAVFCIAFLVVYYLSYRLTKPIKELSKAAATISKGDFKVSVLPYSYDDIGQLCQNFNFMVTKIRELISEISHSKDALDAIINTMQEGLLVLNDKGVIVLSNNSFRKIIEVEDLSGKFYWEGIKHPGLNGFIHELYDKEDKSDREIHLNDQYYICSGLKLDNKTDRLILLYNITDLKNMENLKKDLVANVSHELKSPLTVVKGFVETLEDEVKEEGKQFLVIIKRNIDRLINIVNDLLTLSRLEQNDTVVFRLLNINDVIQHVAHAYSEKTKNKNLQLIVETAVDIPFINGDEFRLEQLLVNLMENALQHTEKGFIKLTSALENRFAVIKIEDSGMGIPAEYKEKVFQRFFVVNPSRSRKYGGTGLGLAIVKHIALLHNGSIFLESETGKGSIFTLKLPLADRKEKTK